MDSDVHAVVEEMLRKFPLPAIDLPATPGRATAVVAGGCFWCTEAVFQEVRGVHQVVSGYAGGTDATANYQAVSTGDTGHAEAVEITYDPAQITYGQLLRIFFATHNPTTRNRQGPDAGPQYRSAIFYANPDEQRVAAAYIQQLQTAHAFAQPIVTTLEPLTRFHPAEGYHQDYADAHPDQPYIRFNALPKVNKLREGFPDLLRK